jgi:hypothetical protein
MYTLRILPRYIPQISPGNAMAIKIFWSTRLRLQYMYLWTPIENSLGVTIYAHIFPRTYPNISILYIFPLNWEWTCG